MQYDRIIREALANLLKNKKATNTAVENTMNVIKKSGHNPANIEKVYNKYHDYSNMVDNPKFKYAKQNYKDQYNLQKVFDVLDEIHQGRPMSKYSDMVNYDFDIANKKIPISQYNTTDNPSYSFKRLINEATGTDYDNYIKNRELEKQLRAGGQQAIDDYSNELLKDYPELLPEYDPMKELDKIYTREDPIFNNFYDNDREHGEAIIDIMLKKYPHLKDKISSLPEAQIHKGLYNYVNPYDDYVKKIKTQYNIIDDLEGYGKTDIKEEDYDKIFKELFNID